MLVHVFCFWLANVIFCCIVSISANDDSLPTSDACANNIYSPFCKLRHCKNFYTNNTERREFIELSSYRTTNLLLEFYVIGSSDCHIHLSPDVNPNQTNYNGVYDFLIGGFNNSRTVVRHGRKILRDFRTANVLSESQPVQFRIETLPSGVIQIYRNDLLLLETVDRNVAPVRYFSFTTDDQLNGMYFYYDCKHVESSAKKFTANAYLKIYALALVICIRLTLFSWR